MLARALIFSAELSAMYVPVQQGGFSVLNMSARSRERQAVGKTINIKCRVV